MKGTRTQDPVIYIGDNGRTLCGAHLGITARYSGRDLSGQRIMPVTAADCLAAGIPPEQIACETCGRPPGRIHVPTES